MNINCVLNKIIKILLVSIICIMLIIGLLFVTPLSVHAESYSAYAVGDYDSSLTQSSTTLSEYSYSTYVRNTVTYYNNIYKASNNTFTDPVYCFLINSTSSNDTPIYILIVASERIVSSSETLSVAYGAGYNQNLSVGASTSAGNNLTYYNSLNLYYKRGGNSLYPSNMSDITLPIYDDIPSGLTAIRNALDNNSVIGGAGGGGGSSSSNYIEAYTDVKAGYVAYILVSEGTTVELSTQFPEFSRNKTPYWDSVARYNEGLDNLPTEGTTFSDTSGFSINWEKLSTDTNAFGQTKSGYVIFTDIREGYFVVYNPTYRSVSSDGRTLISPTIRVWTSDTYGVAQFPIQTSVSLSSEGFTWLSTQTAGGYVANYEDYDSATDTWSYHYPDSTESAIIPNGGGNVLPEDMSISDYLHYIGETLSSLVNDFLSIFTAPLGAIQSLISAGSAFMSTISQFFVWLPAPVYSVLITALILCIVIGVIKLLLK